MRQVTTGSHGGSRLGGAVITDAGDRTLGGHSGMGDPLLDIDGAANRLNVTTRFIRRLVAERRISYLKVGKFIRFHPSDVEHWLEERRIDACE